MTHVFLLAAIAAVQTPGPDVIAARFDGALDALQSMTPTLVIADVPALELAAIPDFDEQEVVIEEPADFAAGAPADDVAAALDLGDQPVLIEDPETAIPADETQIIQDLPAEPATSIDALNDLMALVRDIQRNLGVPAEIPTGADLWRAIAK